MSGIDKALLRRRFNQRAASYDAGAALQRWMADLLVEEILSPLAAGGGPRRVLEIGCGTGYLTARLAALWPAAAITAVDFAPGMIERARRRLQARPVRWIIADVEEGEIGGEFDLIVSSATFQWLTAPKATLRRLTAQLASDGLFAFAAFVGGTFRELAVAFRLAERRLGVPRGSHCPPMPSSRAWRRFLEDEGMRLVVWREGQRTQAYPDARTFLHAVKAIGAAHPGRSATPPRVVREMLALYERYFRLPGGGVRTTYRMLWAAARRRA
ncbi:MAG TPA: methyltransferase domain-containing protein [Limnochordia bacterium]